MTAECQNGYKVSLVIEWLTVNGSLKLVPTKKYTPCPVDPWPIVGGVFLTIILIAAVLLSLMVIVTISTSFTLKKLLYTHIVVNLCVVIIMDCLLNIPIAIAYVTTAPWQFGYNICYCNSFAMFLVTFEMILSVALFAFDRLLVLKKIARYLSLSKIKLKCIILVSWMISISCAIPLIAGFTSMPYRSRYSCTVADPRDDLYMIMMLCLLIISPTIAIVIIALVSIIIIDKERKKQKKVKGQTFSYIEQILMTPYYRNELYPTMCLVVLVLLYFVLWVPYSTLITVTPVITTDWINKTFDESHEFEDHFISLRDLDHDTGDFDADHHNITNADLEQTNLTTNHVHYIPEVSDSPVFETVFIWFRYIFDLLVPIIILITLKDVRIKCESLMFCYRSTNIDSLSPKHMSSGFATTKTPKSSGFSDIRPSRKKPKNEDKKMVNFKTPVLFATAEGLHIRTVEDEFNDFADQKHLLGFGKNATNDPKFSYEMCDVFMNTYTDTSDFDDQNIPTIDAGNTEQDQPFINSLAQEKFSAAVNNYDDDLPVENRNNFSPPKYDDNEMHNPIDKYGTPAEDQFDETIDLSKPVKTKKQVRFDTNLNIKISRPNTPESVSSVESYSSNNSADSGIIGDNEDTHEILPRLKRTSLGAYKQNPKKVVHNKRTLNPNPAVKSTSRYTDARKKFSRNRVSPENNYYAKQSSEPKIRRVKSRYMDHYKKRDNGSASSANSLIS